MKCETQECFQRRINSYMYRESKQKNEIKRKREREKDGENGMSENIEWLVTFTWFEIQKFIFKT